MEGSSPQSLPLSSCRHLYYTAIARSKRESWGAGILRFTAIGTIQNKVKTKGVPSMHCKFCVMGLRLPVRRIQNIEISTLLPLLPLNVEDLINKSLSCPNLAACTEIKRCRQQAWHSKYIAACDPIIKAALAKSGGSSDIP